MMPHEKLIAIAIAITVLGNFSLVYALRRNAIAQGKPAPNLLVVALPGIISLVLATVLLFHWYV